MCCSFRVAPVFQFSMVPMNFLPAGGHADYIVTGVWAQKAVKKPSAWAAVKIAATTEGDQFNAFRNGRLVLDPGAAYVHFTTNNTIYGTQWHFVPDVGVFRSSPTPRRICSSSIDMSKCALVYRRAKRPGACGPDTVIVRDDMLKRTPATLATMLQYGVHAENKSMSQLTPPVFAICIMGLVMKWIKKEGASRPWIERTREGRSFTPRSTARGSIAATRRKTAGRA